MNKIVSLLILTVSADAQYESPCQEAAGGVYRPWGVPPVAGYYGSPCTPIAYNPYPQPPRDYSLLSSLILRPIAHLSNTIFGTASDLFFRTRSNAESGEHDEEVGIRDGIDGEMNSRMGEQSMMEMDNPVPEERVSGNDLPEATEERNSFPDPRFKPE